MVFLMVTVALGLFNATAARTIEDNAERNTRYSIGADVVLQEAWRDNQAASARRDLRPGRGAERASGGGGALCRAGVRGLRLLPEAESVTRV